jgi:DNA replication protein DnaC
MYTDTKRFRVASGTAPGAQSRYMKAVTETCPFCAGSGWKTVPGAEHGVTRCDCQLRARADALIAAARIPKRYEHCELSNFDFEGQYKGLYRARMAACRFVEDYPMDKKGLLFVGDTGVGKTHLAIGIVKALIREKGVECIFYDYAELLKQIQDSYNPSVQATELGLLRPVFETEVLALDDLGSVRPTEWRWDTIRLILNTRYNDSRTTIITTNFSNKPPAGVADRRPLNADNAAAIVHTDGPPERDQPDSKKYTLGDRIGEPMRSRLHEMCRIIKMVGPDHRKKDAA